MSLPRPVLLTLPASRQFLQRLQLFVLTELSPDQVSGHGGPSIYESKGILQEKIAGGNWSYARGQDQWPELPEPGLRNRPNRCDRDGSRSAKFPVFRPNNQVRGAQGRNCAGAVPSAHRAATKKSRSRHFCDVRFRGISKDAMPRAARVCACQRTRAVKGRGARIVRAAAGSGRSIESCGRPCKTNPIEANV